MNHFPVQHGIVPAPNRIAFIAIGFEAATFLVAHDMHHAEHEYTWQCSVTPLGLSRLALQVRESGVGGAPPLMFEKIGNFPIRIFDARAAPPTVTLD